mgnify:CR=1 FL=1
MPAEKVHEVNSPATPTPYVDDGRVHVYFGAYGLLCYDLDGRELWRKPIPTPKSLYGSATSPIGHGDHLILVVDNEATDRALLAELTRLQPARTEGPRALQAMEPAQR